MFANQCKIDPSLMEDGFNINNNQPVMFVFAGLPSSRTRRLHGGARVTERMSRDGKHFVFRAEIEVEAKIALVPRLATGLQRVPMAGGVANGKESVGGT